MSQKVFFLPDIHVATPTPTVEAILANSINTSILKAQEILNEVK